MTVEISSAPGQFPALTARMLRLELEAAKIIGPDFAAALPALFIFVDSGGNVEIRRQKQREGQRSSADDKSFKYPFRTDAIVAAVARCLGEAARGQQNDASAESAQPKRAGETDRAHIMPDDANRLVSVGSASVVLTEREYRLFRYLYDRPNRAVSREELLRAVWDGGTGEGTNIVEVYVSYLRRKLEDTAGERLIFTRRGEGYEFRARSGRPGNKS